MFFNKSYLEIFVFYTSFWRYFVDEFLKILCGKMSTNCFKLFFICFILFFFMIVCFFQWSRVFHFWLLKTTLQKNWFLLSNLCKIEVIITFLIKMRDLRRFAQRKTSTIEFEWNDKTLLVATWAEIMMSKLYYFKIPIF